MYLQKVFKYPSYILIISPLDEVINTWLVEGVKNYKLSGQSYSAYKNEFHCMVLKWILNTSSKAKSSSKMKWEEIILQQIWTWQWE